MVVVDECHCVTSWGYGFRSDYLKIGEFINNLPVKPVIAALTATATPDMRKQIRKLLSMDQPEVFVNSLHRKNLHFMKRSFVSDEAKLKELKRLLKKHKDGSCIVYCNTKKMTDAVYEEVKVWYPDDVVKCHSNLNGQLRKENELLFLKGERKIMIATSAFGLGVDQSSVDLVIHFNLPLSLIDYYQQAGRAGRAGQKAKYVLPYCEDDYHVKLDKDTYKELVKRVDKMLKKLKVPCSIDEMKISRCDLPINIEFASQDVLMEYLRIFKKSILIRNYSHVFFHKDDQKAKDHKAANKHSYCISCKSAGFLIYDKTAQLEMIDRWDEALMDKHILRFEAELKRPALKKHLGKSAMATNYKLLSAATKDCKKVVDWYIDRLQPKCERYVRYEDAVTLIENAKLSKKARERMLYLLRKTSDKESLSAALEAMQEKFHLKKAQCRSVLKKFQKLGISPITLANNSKFEELPALRI